MTSFARGEHKRLVRDGQRISMLNAKTKGAPRGKPALRSASISGPNLLQFARLICYQRRVSERREFRLGILGSGKGSNMVAIAEACAAGKVPATVAIVLSDVPDAGILERAKGLGLNARHIPPGRFRTKLDEEAEQASIAALREARVDLVALAGFMRILKGGFLRAFDGRVVNIHPSLLPSFPGLEAWKQALDYGVKVTGVTVHFVDQGVDTGPIIAQRAVPVRDDDTPATLHARIQEVERVLYPEAIAALARGEIRIDGRRTFRRV